MDKARSLMELEKGTQSTCTVLGAILRYAAFLSSSSCRPDITHLF